MVCSFGTKHIVGGKWFTDLLNKRKQQLLQIRKNFLMETKRGHTTWSWERELGGGGCGLLPVVAINSLFSSVYDSTCHVSFFPTCPNKIFNRVRRNSIYHPILTCHDTLSLLIQLTCQEFWNTNTHTFSNLIK